MFTAVGLLYFFFIFFLKRRISFRRKRSSNKRAELAPVISNFLFHSPDDPKDEQKEYVNLKIAIREYLRDPVFRKILTEILMDLQKDVSGHIKLRLHKLYRELDLHHDAFSKLKSWRWEVVSKGILQLTQMQVPESYRLITKFINHKRSAIRKQAEIATVKLRHEGINYVLDNTKYDISEWQQLKLIEALGTLEDFVPPKFKAWLISENKGVVLFALRLIKHYNQNEAAPSIIQLVKHKNDQVKGEAIQCIKEFLFFDALPTLKAVFWNCGPQIKIQVLDAIAILGSDEDVPFLGEIEKHEANFLVKRKAMGTINTIVPDSILPTKDIHHDLAVENPNRLPIDDIEVKNEIEVLETPELSGINIIAEEVVAEVDEETIGNERIEAIELTTFEVIEPIDITNIEVVVEPVDVVEEIQDEPIPDEVIDVAEIEIYDLVEMQNDAEMEAESDEEEVLEPQNDAFEIAQMPDTMNVALNDNLGLLASKEGELPEDFENPQLESAFHQMSMDEKVKFIDSIEASGDIREIGLLERIMEKEEDAELRFRAFLILKRIKSQNPEEGEKRAFEPQEHEENEAQLSAAQESIFYPLFNFASDLDSKLILLKEIVEVGDAKEIPFLEGLSNHSENKVREFSAKAIEVLKAKPLVEHESIIPLDDSALPDFDLTSIEEESHKQETTEPIEDGDNGLLPLELCFLFEELDIDHSNRKKLEEFDFELSEEFHLEVAKKNFKKNNQEDNE